jgi:small-conductance mechanosensitive channel
MGIGEVWVPLVTFGILFLFGLALKKFLLKAFTGWAKDSKSKLADIVIRPLKVPCVIWWLLFSIFFALKVSNLPEDIVSIFNKLILLVSIISVTSVTANISGKLIKFYAKEGESALAITSLTRNTTKIAIFTCGALILLNSLGITITPLLTALGVGGLAVALALQDTLSNLFAGLQITVARGIRVGDYVQLEPGQEGYVMDINWRSTNIRTLSDNVVIVPNAKLAQAIVTNFYLPDKQVAVTVEAGVHYDSDLNKVEKITADVAREVMKEAALAAASFEPVIRYHTFGESGINFTVILKSKEFAGQYLIKHEFIKRLHARYKKEAIVWRNPPKEDK